ncbi:MAG: ATP-binding cassette domain-containing protein [Actinophytocola sp.]|nr:ATP-binding cassette domain-containing protein [Actinophytocola sp.]
MTLLRTEGLKLRFGGVVALDDVSISIDEGEIVGLLGPNGAGKTTLFNVISGLLKPESGRIELGGRNITRALPYERALAGLGRTFQHIKLFGSHTVEENLLAAQHRHLSSSTLAAMLRLPSWRRDEVEARRRVDAVLELINLERYRHHRPAELSYGTLRFVELAAVLSLQPRLLLLDEPASGIAQREAEALGPLLREIRDVLGCTIFLIEHDMPLLLSVSERVYALDFGQVIAEGEPDEVTADDRVLSSYLGRTRRDDVAAR